MGSKGLPAMGCEPLGMPPGGGANGFPSIVTKQDNKKLYSRLILNLSESIFFKPKLFTSVFTFHGRWLRLHSPKSKVQNDKIQKSVRWPRRSNERQPIFPKYETFRIVPARFRCLSCKQSRLSYSSIGSRELYEKLYLSREHLRFDS